MALRPELMMVDFSPIQQAAQTFTTGMQNRRMKQVEGLAGKALMGDPNAMQNLSQLDPMIAAKVQGQLGEQQAAQQQAKYQQDLDFAEQQKDFFKMGSKAKNVEELNNLARFSFEQGLHPAIRRKMQEQGISQFDEEDLAAIKVYDAMQGGSGFSGMEFKDVFNIYDKNPIVQDYQKTTPIMEGIKTAYKDLLKDPKNAAAQFNIAKAAIQMVESGVVRPEEFTTAAGVGLPADLSDKGIKDWLETKLLGQLTIKQATDLARMGMNNYNAKAKSVQNLQENLRQANLGTHEQAGLFATATGKESDNFIVDKDIPYTTKSGKQIIFRDVDAFDSFLKELRESR